MVTGSCLCGAVRWRIDGPLTGMTHCHCSMCRKAHGAPFATYAAVDPESVTFLSGHDDTSVFESSPGVVRTFCSRCGSVVPVQGDPEVPVGGLDGDPGARPEAHIFAAFQAPWHTIADDLPRHDIWGEEMEGPVVDMPARAAPETDVLHGSCLCNAITFEVQSRFTRVHNCHCSRCRKARARGPHDQRLSRYRRPPVHPWRRPPQDLASARCAVFRTGVLCPLRFRHAPPRPRAHGCGDSLRIP